MGPREAATSNAVSETRTASDRIACQEGRGRREEWLDIRPDAALMRDVRTPISHFFSDLTPGVLCAELPPDGRPVTDVDLSRREDGWPRRAAAQ